MSFPKSIVKAVEDYVTGCDGWRDIAAMAGAANADLHYGDLSGYDGLRESGIHPGGFVRTCKAIAEYLQDEVGTLYVEEDSGCVSTREPSGDGECDTCDGSGYVWGEARSEHETGCLCDCPNDNCNAFGQMDMPYYRLDPHDVASILFGELAEYLR